jgi:UDP-N-acetylmuramate--alanine ligase
MEHLHFIGIKGVGMSALALVAQGLGYTVTGSDVAEQFITDAPLRQAGVRVFELFAAENIAPTVTKVVAGAAYGSDNPEYAEAERRKLPIVTYSQLLGELSSLKKTIAIAGTHGKTTTSAITSYLLMQSGYDPSYVIGTGSVPGLPSHGRTGTGDYFVTEADDYKRAPDDPTPKFLDLKPYVGLITSIEHDHPDLYPTLEDCVEAFYQFARRVSPNGFLVVNGDSETIHDLIHRLHDETIITFGFSLRTDYQIVIDDPSHFSLIYQGEKIGPFEIRIPGRHNLYNAAAALTILLHLGIPAEKLQQHLPGFSGTERRFQYLGQNNDVLVFDDYAHHPTAITLTLEAAKQMFPEKQLFGIFQPHTYSRTKAFLPEFGRSFTDADTVVITDIFGSAREKEVTITAERLADEVRKHHNNVLYVPYQQLEQYLESQVVPGSVVILMGAGDIYKVGRHFVEKDVHDARNL